MYQLFDYKHDLNSKMFLYMMYRKTNIFHKSIILCYNMMSYQCIIILLYHYAIHYTAYMTYYTFSDS
jgi:hypothetical protein